MGFLDIIKKIFGNNKKTAKILTTDFDKIFGEKEPFSIILNDKEGNLLSDKKVKIEVNKVPYEKTTDSDGVASLNINLPCGTYPAFVDFEDNEYKSTRSYSKITVSPKLTTQDMTMQERDGSQFIAIVTSATGVRLEGVPVTFTINGKEYQKTSGLDGEAKLNINLAKGDYEIKTTSFKTTKTNKIHIDERPKKVTKMEGTNISKAYSDKIPYQCAVYDDNGRVAGNVDIIVNGVKYTKQPDSTGLYQLNINLKPGTYKITAIFHGDDDHLGSQIVNTIHIVEDPKRVYNPIRMKYQPNSYTCGPTSLSMCSQILGNEVSINSFSNAFTASFSAEMRQ